VTGPDEPAKRTSKNPSPGQAESVRADVPPAKLSMGRTERRVVFAVLVTALIPLVAALFMARAMVARVSAVAFQPEFGMHLDRALELYADLARVTKQSMRHETDAIALRSGLERAAKADDREALAREFDAVMS